MTLPFTTAEFFGVIAAYNQAVWPAQPFLAAGAAAAFALALKPTPASDRVVCGYLALLWFWSAIVYHVGFFHAVNPAAPLFAALSLAGAALFVWFGVVRDDMRFGWGGAGRYAAAALAVYALAVYPLVSLLSGHGMISVGLPCPTTLLAIAMLLLLQRPAPRAVFVVPLLWAAVGIQAAWLFGAAEDLALGPAAALALWRVLGEFPERSAA